MDNRKIQRITSSTQINYCTLSPILKSRPNFAEYFPPGTPIMMDTPFIPLWLPVRRENPRARYPKRLLNTSFPSILLPTTFHMNLATLPWPLCHLCTRSHGFPCYPPACQRCVHNLLWRRRSPKLFHCTPQCREDSLVIWDKFPPGTPIMMDAPFIPLWRPVG